ncbi:MAG: hypothetical protein HQK96_04090 [Nitrospirae bacterium]|nr:hypothetical protein [Nitrospirota bacterium]
MSMTEAQLLADLASIYLSVSPNPMVCKVQDDKNITQMSVEVLESGLSEKDKKPIANNKPVLYFVYKRGQGGLEQAFYSGDQPYNTALKDVTISASSYLAIANLYNSVVLQNRVLSAVMLQCSVVFQESTTSVTSLTIGTGSQSLTVGTGQSYYVGQQLTISNGANSMIGNVTSYNSTTGALVVNITSVTGSGTLASWNVVPTNHANRMKLINKANLTAASFRDVVMSFMCAIALNATVQAAGTAVADSVLQSIVMYSWDSYASIIVA